MSSPDGQFFQDLLALIKTKKITPVSKSFNLIKLAGMGSNEISNILLLVKETCLLLDPQHNGKTVRRRSIYGRMEAINIKYTKKTIDINREASDT